MSFVEIKKTIKKSTLSVLFFIHDLNINKTPKGHTAYLENISTINKLELSFDL